MKNLQTLFTSLTILFLLLISTSTFAQTNVGLGIYYGAAGAMLDRTDDIEGAAGTEVQNIHELGLRTLIGLTEKISLETGLNYQRSEVIITSHFIGETLSKRNEKLELLSIPIYVNYSFGKYFFMNGGPLLDFQLGDNSTDSQNGIGYSLGLGAKYSVNHMTFFANPNFKRHSFIPFEKENYHQKLTSFGIRFGIGYTF